MKAILDVEFARAHAAREADIQDIEGMLAVSDGEYSPEQIQSAKRLVVLVPTHPLALQVLASRQTPKSAQADNSAGGGQSTTEPVTSGC